ncbi:hypothetical protein [Enterobacter mori]|uniref:hypothetical protein n=1 Tax=Enterobacter mori TaxID=539813 RepID=UPI003B84127A
MQDTAAYPAAQFRFYPPVATRFQLKVLPSVVPFFCAFRESTAPLSPPRFVNNQLTQSDICHFLLLHKDEKMW